MISNLNTKRVCKPKYHADRYCKTESLYKRAYGYPEPDYTDYEKEAVEKGIIKGTKMLAETCFS